MATLFNTNNAFGKNFSVSSASEVKAILPELKPGDNIVMANGTWTDQHIKFAAKGTEESPITLRAQTNAMVILNGQSKLEISGDWLVVDGLRFEGGALKSGSIVNFTGPLGNATNSRFTNSSIISYNPTEIETRYFWVSLRGQHNRVDHNYFYNQNHSGVTVVVWRDTPTPDFHRIDSNHFADRPEGKGNGFETIRVGTSTECESTSSSIVESNLFERTDGEMEIISNKSCGNVFQYNTFFQCAGTLTLRHGHNNLVQGNFFLGDGKERTGGLRVIGRNQVVVNNYFSNLSGRADGAIAITAGVLDTPLNGYSQVENAIIAHNTIVNVKRSAIALSQGLGSSKRTLRAKKVTIANNVMIGQNDPLFDGEQGEGWKWEGNVAYGQSLGPLKDGQGIQTIDPKLAQDEKGLWRPQKISPLIDKAVGDFRKYVNFDMDGQARDEAYDIGADELSDAPIKRSPLTAKDVGPPLTISLSQGSGDGTFAATVTRNKNSSKPLEVTIRGSGENMMKISKKVTIPADKNSVDFDIVADGDGSDRSKPITIVALAGGYLPGTATLSTEDDD